MNESSSEESGRNVVSLPTGLQLSNHPVLMHKLLMIRKKETSSREFRSLFREISFYLGFESTRDLNTKVEYIKTNTVEHWAGRKLSDRVAIIPILRGGLGMTDAMLELLPNSPVYHIGMYRNPGSNMPVQYYNRLPKGMASDVAIILDPLIISSKTICATISIVKKWGAKQVKVVTFIASKPGIDQLMEKHPDITVHCAAVDELSPDGETLVPGIGDAGDRLYLSPNYFSDDGFNSPVFKRNRSDASAFMHDT